MVNFCDKTTKRKSMEEETIRCENCFETAKLEDSVCDMEGYWICSKCMDIAKKEASFYKTDN